MRRIGRLLLIIVLATIGTAGLIFLHYNDELDHARTAAERGGVIVSTLAGPKPMLPSQRKQLRPYLVARPRSCPYSPVG
jgi:hypothetical protein